jgi:hypothetical protein
MCDQNDRGTSQEDQWSPPTSLSQYSNMPVASSFCKRFKIQDNLSPCSSATSSISIDNIAISNNQPTNMQMQPPSFSDEAQRGNDTGNLNTPKDITDDISLTFDSYFGTGYAQCR